MSGVSVIGTIHVNNKTIEVILSYSDAMYNVNLFLVMIGNVPLIS